MIAIVSSLLVATALAGCDPLVSGDDPIAVRLSDGELEVAVCTPWSLTKVLVQTRLAGFATEWQDVWVAEGRAEIASGDVLSSASVPVGLAASSWGEPDLGPSSELSITLVGLNAETLDASLVVPLEGLPADEWIQADGVVTATACDD